MFNTDDTICAIASAAGQAQRGIVRISGPDAAACLKSMLNESVDLQEFQHPTVTVETLRIGEFPPCKAQFYFWPDHRSYTRQPSVEIHLPGAAPLLQAALNYVCQVGGEQVRIAEPGEFTKRAFLNGKLDLSQAEAVADLISSESKGMHKVALHQLKGHFSNELGFLVSAL